METKQKKAKSLYLMKIFLEETDEDHGLTLREINARLEGYGIKPVSRNTLYGDIDELRTFGLDIITDQRGNNLCYFLASKAFELPELKLLVDSVQASRFMTEKKSRELISKLEGLASRHEARELHRQVLISGRVKSMNESIYYSVDKLNNAINLDSQIRFQYWQWDVDKHMVLRHDGDFYTVSPWALVFDNENYYLVAYSNGEIRHFRVDKMVNIAPTGEPRKGRDLFHEDDYTKKSVFGMFGGEVVSVVLEGDNRMAGVVIDRFGTDTPMTNVGGNRFEARVEVAVSPQFIGWIIGLGPDIRIAGPTPVVRQVQREVRRLMKQYLPPEDPKRE